MLPVESEHAGLRSGTVLARFRVGLREGLGASREDSAVANSFSIFVNDVLGADFDPSTPNGNPNANSLCGKTITVTSGGNSVSCVISDRFVFFQRFSLRSLWLTIRSAL